MRTIPGNGLPPRGSVQDRIACEMLIRERRREVQSQIYIARIQAAGLQIPEKIFRLWTTLYTMEVTHENYAPSAVQEKERALKVFESRATEELQERERSFARLEALTVTDEDLRPLTTAEREELKRKLRRRHIQPATFITKPRETK